MNLRACACAVLLLAGLSAPAAADQFSAKLTAFNPTTGLMILNDRTTLGVDKKIIEGTMEVGATVTVHFVGTENGFERIDKVVITPPGSAPAAK
ncbi:MAG: hypothetical protein H6876_06625 [Hyphomicrobiaceae bacterium]|nr:hypothetical protein [Hyphomicrobiaceae bacterium]MCC0007784.1 hypothetical protein [Hyphomicrobiaceae bacterium]